MTDELARVWIHKDLVTEFLLWKEKIEAKTGKKINGGTPVVSKMFAEVMKNKRLNNKQCVKVELNKIKGTQKNEVFFLP